MKYIAISGGWREVTPRIERKIRETVAKIIQNGDSIISGGALNTDSIALDEALKHNPSAQKIKIYLPTTLKKYSEHYRKHAKLGTITAQQAENLIKQLSNLRKINPGALSENPNENFNEKTKKEMYYERSSKIIEASDELVAFHIQTEKSRGEGTMDTIRKAKVKGIPVKVFRYQARQTKHGQRAK